MHLLPRSWVSGTKRGRMLLFLGFIIVVIVLAPWIKTIGVQDVDSPDDEPHAVVGDKGGRQETFEGDGIAKQKTDEPTHIADPDVVKKQVAWGLAADSKNNQHKSSDIIDNNHELHEAEVLADVHKPSTDHHPANTTTLHAHTAVYFEEHLGKSCQNYAEDPPVVRNLADSKAVCLASDDCNAIECNHGRSDECTLRQLPNGVTYAPADCYMKIDPANALARIHPKYNELLKEYPFQQVTTQTGQQVNIILVRSPFGASGNAKHLYEQYQNEILFMGISSFEDYPLDSHNPYSPRLDEEYFLGAFPGFLHMMHHPEKHFPPHVKTILMSQSDFQLPRVPESSLHMPKKYDFTYSATWPLGPTPNNECLHGWSSYCKNWSFVLEALEVFCERNMTGVLVATRDIPGKFKCDLPAICEGKILQTSFISQELYFSYVKQSRFSFIPQIHDASPRVSTQALVLNVPLLMNKHISGGWKYIDEKTGEFFSDMTDFRESLDRLLLKAKNGKYEPRKWALENYDNPHSGKRLYDFVMKNFGDRVHLPKNTKLLLT